MFFRDSHQRPAAEGAADQGGIRPSPGLEELVRALERIRAPVRVLDLAPVDEKNLLFLAERGFEVQVAALSPDPSGRVELPPYESGMFHGILGWDYPIRLDGAHRVRLAEALQRWLAPGGELLLILPIASHGPGRAHRFRIRGPGRIEYRPLGPAFGDVGMPTREVLSLFPELDGSGARVVRQGSREFVLRRSVEDAG